MSKFGQISRRHLLGTGLAAGVAGCATGDRELGNFTSVASAGNKAFAHGVASGDPAQDGFVIWTRVTPDNPKALIGISWQVSETEDFSTVVLAGSGETNPGRDWTFKQEITGLASGKTYYYRFRAGESVSPTGRAKTLPEGELDSARFAIVSCSNYPFGYFNVYDQIARGDFDAVIHLGDYIYEYGRNEYGGETGRKLGREHNPPAEIYSLTDYRTRHAQYKADPASQAMHGAHPLIAIWDDHETSNNSWEDGAQNHTPDEGDWDKRRADALQAYYEWMPVRDPKPGRTRESLYRSFSWGNLLTLASIETRLTARTLQLDYADFVGKLQTPADIVNFRENILAKDDRRLMGDDQMNYLREAFATSRQKSQPWRVVANQVIMAEVAAPDLTPYENEPFIDEIAKELPRIRDFIKFSALGLPLNLDAWDGYPAARERLYQMAADENARDLLVLTGDTHEYWANDLFRQDGTKMGVELGTASVTSPGASSYFGAAAADYSLLLRQKNKTVRYHDPASKGFIDLTLTQSKGAANYVSVSTILEPAYTASVTASFDVVQRGGSLEITNPRGLGFKERVVYGK